MMLIHGRVTAADAKAAVREVDEVLRRHHVEDGTRLRLTASAEHSEIVLAQANTWHHDDPIRAQISGHRRFIATLIAERLDWQLTRARGDGGTRVWPDPARLPLAWVSDSRPIVRRKEFRPIVMSPGDAVRTMDAMDYDVHLFTDAETGEDAIVFWAGPSGARLARQHRMHLPTGASEPILTVHSRPTMLLSEPEATERLCRYGLPFLFFTEPRSRRGRLLLRRYDGNHTLLIPERGHPPSNPRNASR